MGTDTDIESTGEPGRRSVSEPGLPFAWDGGRPDAEPVRPEGLFRFPTEGDPGPGTRRLLVMAIYSSVLGLLGLAVAARGIVAIAADTAPGWYEPALGGAAGAGVGLVVAAFLSIHRQALPWLLFALAAVPLGLSIAATMQAV
jgi:hypothetical protein